MRRLYWYDHVKKEHPDWLTTEQWRALDDALLAHFEKHLSIVTKRNELARSGENYFRKVRVAR